MEHEPMNRLHHGVSQKIAIALFFFPEICLETNGFKPLGYLESKLTTKMGVLNPIDGANM